MIPYQKTNNPTVIVVDAKTKEVSTKTLNGIYYRIVPPANVRANFLITCSEMHVDRFASATDSTMIISDKLRSQLCDLR